MDWVGYSDSLYRERFTFCLGGIEMMTLILFLTALNTILILYFHWQQEERNLEVLNRLKHVEDSGKEL